MRILMLALVAASLAACAARPEVTGNAQGGVMDWFATNEREAFLAAQGHCQKYGRDARITQIVPRAGGSVAFECVKI